MNYFRALFLLTLITNFSLAQNPGSGVTDADGNFYETLIFGEQEVMKQNLKTTKFCNGDEIENIEDFNEWSNLNTAAWSYYNNDVINNDVYGKLYNYFTVADSRNVCPCDWHVPTEEEWNELLNFLGGPGVSQNVGGKMKEVGFEHWNSPNFGATNESNFTALPGGARLLFSNFFGIREQCNLWTSTEFNADNSYKRDLGYNGNLFSGSTTISKKTGISIRCMKNTNLSNTDFIKNQIKIYPNPTNNNINIILTDIQFPVNYKLIDFTGKLLKSGELKTYESFINISEFSSGIYYLILNSSEVNLNYKIIKN
jgi:uncharacterized protein (TIGR02145 family)